MITLYHLDISMVKWLVRSDAQISWSCSMLQLTTQPEYRLCLNGGGKRWCFRFWPSQQCRRWEKMRKLILPDNWWFLCFIIFITSFISVAACIPGVAAQFSWWSTLLLGSCLLFSSVLHISIIQAHTLPSWSLSLYQTRRYLICEVIEINNKKKLN